MGDACVSGGAVSGHDVDQSRWETGGGSRLSQQQRGRGRQPGGLDNDGVPAGERDLNRTAERDPREGLAISRIDRLQEAPDGGGWRSPAINGP